MRRYVVFMLAAAILTGACDSRNLEQQTSETAPVMEPAVTTISAGFESAGTKSILSLSGDYASVLWQSGDSFTLRSISCTDDYSRAALFTTSFTGEPRAKAVFTGTVLEPLEYFLACYPPSAYLGFVISSDNKPIGAGILPKNQTATANSYDPEANLAFAFAPASSGFRNLTFRNAAALLKICVSGTKVDQLESIRVQNNDENMAGLITVSGFDSEIQVEKDWEYDANSNSVTLAGPFEKDVDYYIAVAPGTYRGLSVVFSFRDKSFISKTLLNQPVSFDRSTIRNLGTFELNSTANDNVTVYSGTTPAADHASVCVIPDGFQASERDVFLARANAAMDYLFTVSPFKELKDRIKVYFLWTPSQESGATITDGAGNIKILRNTAFGTKWGEDTFQDMRANDDDVFSFVAANCPDIVSGAKMMEQVPVLMLVNDTRYGGRALTYSSGKSYCMVPFMYAGEELVWQINHTTAATTDPSCVSTESTRTMTPSELDALYGDGMAYCVGDWRNVLIHEFGGHSIGRLADEYWYDSYYPAGDIKGHFEKVPSCLNVAGWWYDDENTSHPFPWAALLEKKASLVAKDTLYERIGVYHGGDVSLFNRWRSEEVSCMIDNRPYFSTWQRILIAARISSLAGIAFDMDSYLSTIDNPIDPVRDGGGSSVKFRVTKAPAPILPMLPPPILIDDTVRPSSVPPGFRRHP